MCGISGFIDTSRRHGDKALQELVLGMANPLRHRRPDDVGIWADATQGIAMGHRRLSILDLSPLGHQPMQSTCGRYITSFNGEIYNFKALRQELESLGYRFRGHSDTEVMLSCMSQWGLESAVTRFNGMFAIAVWDREERLLHLVRDRMGEKPLYYGWAGKTFLFASELKGTEPIHSFMERLIARRSRCSCVTITFPRPIPSTPESPKWCPARSPRSRPTRPLQRKSPLLVARSSGRTRNGQPIPGDAHRGNHAPG